MRVQAASGRGVCEPGAALAGLAWSATSPSGSLRCAAPLAGRPAARKPSRRKARNSGPLAAGRGVAIGPAGRYSPRTFRAPLRRQAPPVRRRTERRLRCSFRPHLPRPLAARRRQHAGVAAAVRPDLRDHVFPDPAAAAEAREAASGDGQERAPRRHRRHLGRPGRQGHQGDRRRPDRGRDRRRTCGCGRCARWWPTCAPRASR